MSLFNILVGGVLLFFGRRLFWLFVAAAGFLVGARLATDWLGGEPGWLILLIAIGSGAIGALICVFLQRLMFGFGGFLAGGYVLYSAAFEFGCETHAWIALLLGGVLGAVLVLALLDWALITLSALTGAIVVAQSAALDRGASVLLFLVLLALGIAFQARQLARKTPSAKKRESRQAADRRTPR